MSKPTTEERIQNKDGLNILVRSWRPEGTPRAIVAVVPGFNSHSGYYFWTAEQLVANGFAVYSVDLRGRGESDGERFYVQSFADYLSDVDLMVNLARSREPGLPVFMLGHSAGGVISSVYTLEYQKDLAGLICESFAFRVPAPDFVLAVLKGISHLAPHAHVFKLNNDDFSRDPAVVKFMDDDPLIANETQPTQTVAEMVRADERLEREFPLFTLPLFIMHGTLDKATKPSGSQLFYDTASSPDKTLKLYEGYFHDLLNDVDREFVMADINSWLDTRVPARKSESVSAQA
jgi:alpha-beta hydrolase superfamily lysophospholipase